MNLSVCCHRGSLPGRSIASCLAFISWSYIEVYLYFMASQKAPKANPVFSGSILSKDFTRSTLRVARLIEFLSSWLKTPALTSFGSTASLRMLSVRSLWNCSRIFLSCLRNPAGTGIEETPDVLWLRAPFVGFICIVLLLWFSNLVQCH